MIEWEVLCVDERGSYGGVFVVGRSRGLGRAATVWTGSAGLPGEAYLARRFGEWSGVRGL
jgi:hypothetical protein